MKKFLIQDCGIYLNLANDLAAKGENLVRYYTDYGSAFPSYREYATGDGMDKEGKTWGFEDLIKCDDFFDFIEESDCIGTFDCSKNDLIEFLRKLYPDKSIFGAGWMARLEDDRLMFKRFLEKLKLPVIPYTPVKGFDNLRKHLKENPGKVVKTNIFRKDFESLVCKDFQSVKQLLVNREPAFGCYADEMIFIVEDFVESVVEAGFDGFYTPAGGFQHFSYGIEFDKNFYLGRVGGELPDVLRSTLDVIDPYFAKKDYRGLISTEERIVSQKEHYFIDPCLRGAMPLGVLFGRYIKNWPEVMYNVGLNQPFEIDCDHKYVAAMSLTSRNAEDFFTYIKFAEGHRDDFRLMMACQDKEGNHYSVKGLEAIVVAVAAGETPQEAVDNLKATGEWVEAHGLENDELKQIDIDETIKKAASVGIVFD